MIIFFIRLVASNGKIGSGVVALNMVSQVSGNRQFITLFFQNVFALRASHEFRVPIKYLLLVFIGYLTISRMNSKR